MLKHCSQVGYSAFLTLSRKCRRLCSPVNQWSEASLMHTTLHQTFYAQNNELVL